MTVLPPLRRRSVLRFALGAVVLLGLLVCWRVWQVRGDLLQARDYAEALRSAGDERDLPDARVALRELQQHAGDAASGTSGPSWWLVERLPVVGDDAQAIARASAALSSVADSGDPLLQFLSDVDRGSLAPVEGRIPLDRVEAISPALTAFATAVQDAEADLDALDGDYVPTLGTALAEVRSSLTDLAPRVERARQVVDQAPAFLGADKPMRYLLIFQNNGEIRATGGLPGSAAEIVADGGRITLKRTFSPITLDERKPARFDLSRAERTLYGPLIQRHSAIFLNSMPDRARAARLFAEGATKWLGHSVDGVLLVDTVTLGYLMGATGPITVGGVNLDADNAVEELLYGTYQRLPGLRDQDRFFEKVSAAVFSRLTGASTDPAKLVGALRQSFDEGRTYLYPTDSDLRSAIDGINDPESSEDLAIGLNDVGGGKMSYFLRSQLTTAVTCRPTASTATVRVALSSRAPRDASDLPDRFENGGQHWQPVRDGAQLVQVVAMLPRGWSLSSLTVDSKRAPYRTARVEGRTAVTFQTEIRAQEEDVAVLHLRGARTSPLAGATLTPGVTGGRPVIDVTMNGC